MVFCQSLVSGRHVCFNFRWGVLAASSLVSSLVGSSVGSLVGSSSSSSLGSSSSGYRYGFTTIVLKLVGPLGSYTLYISLLILSNLNRLVHLPLYLVLPSCHISMSELREVIDYSDRWTILLVQCIIDLLPCPDPYNLLYCFLYSYRLLYSRRCQWVKFIYLRVGTKDKKCWNQAIQAGHIIGGFYCHLQG